MPWSDGKIWATTQLPCKRGPALLSQIGKRPGHPCNWLSAMPVAQNNNAASSMRQGQLGLGGDNTHKEKEQHDKQRQA